ELWKITGFHRPLAGFWWNYSILLVLALPGILVIGFVLPNYILPFPEALGFSNVVTSILGPLYLFADFGIKEAVSRFISQYSETNPRKAIDYLSFYFYYQMWTGFVQVTIISCIAIYLLPYTDISYAGWMFLVYILIQWPGTPGLFLSALGGFQQFAKQNVLVVIQNVVFQTATQVGFIFLGRYIGSATPMVGELVGATMGFIVGSYVDDFIAMAVGAYMFSKVIKPFGMRLKSVLVIRFDRKLVKEVLVYGGKVLPSGLSYVGVNAAIAFMLVAWFESYSTYVGLYTLASGLIGALGVSFSISEPISQAYNNGKKELALFYIRSQLQWWGVISVGVLMAPLLFLIPSVLGKIAGEYAEVKWMIFPLFLGAFILFPTNFSGIICQACDLPQHSTYMNFIEQGTRIVFYFIALSPWTVSAWWGNQYVIYWWLIGEAPGYALKGVYGWYIVRKKLFPGQPIRFPLYKTLGAPAMILGIFLVLSIAMNSIFEAVYAASDIAGYGLAALYLILLLFGFPIFILMPLLGLLGAWDDQTLEDFRRCALMSGPSKKLVMTLYRTARFGYDRSPLKGRFVSPFEQAMKEAKELTEGRREMEAKL
ncbi:MAG: hypothetical protein JW839_20090, partial [Candidatus Lokiarchaeota archaeon]|nr:hypothetical protein [Candidatus Lokiarchaeota archaeon]